MPHLADPSTNAVNDLMTRVDEINAKSPTELTDVDLDVLIAYHRRARAKLAAGDKPPRGARSKAAMPLAELISLAKPAGILPAPAIRHPPSPSRPGLRRI